MYPSRAKSLVLFLLLSGGFTSAFGQTSTTSNPLTGRDNNPYSKYGIGELKNGNNTVLKGMGNITSAYENPYAVNTDNPASYSFLQRTTFEVGATFNTRTLKNSVDSSYTSGTGTLDYLSIGIPVTKHGGMCLGFRPYAHTFYNLQDSLYNTPIGSVGRQYTGEGSLNYAFIGGAARYKGLSIGFNFGYLFGTLNNTTLLLPSNSYVVNQAYTSQSTFYNRIGGIYWKAGALYEGKLDSSYSIRIGGTFTLGQNLNDRLNAYQLSIFNFGDTLVRDTSYYPGEQKGKLQMPMSYSFGVMLMKNDKWSLGVDYTATQWSTFKSTVDDSLHNGVGSQAYKISIGGEYTPDVNNIRSYFSRVTYRLGGYYGIDYLNLQNNTLPYYGITAGASFPFRRSLSRVHVALDLGRLGTTANNLIQETYARFTLGLSLNDRWFIPRKYE